MSLLTDSSASSHGRSAAVGRPKEGRSPELGRGAVSLAAGPHARCPPTARHPQTILTQGLSSQSSCRWAAQEARPPGCTGRHSSGRGGGGGGGSARTQMASIPISGTPPPFLKGSMSLPPACPPHPQALSSTFTLRLCKGHGAGETPYECVVDGEPAEVGVPIALRGPGPQLDLGGRWTARGGGQGTWESVKRTSGLQGPDARRKGVLSTSCPCHPLQPRDLSRVGLRHRVK